MDLHGFSSILADFGGLSWILANFGGVQLDFIADFLWISLRKPRLCETSARAPAQRQAFPTFAAEYCRFEECVISVVVYRSK